VDFEVGDLQGISNIEAPNEWRLYEAWIEQQIRSPQLSLLAGVCDLNAEFDVIPSAGDLLNSSFGLGPEYSFSGDAGPSAFPNTSLAVRIKFQPVSSVYALVGVSDGLPGGSSKPRFSMDHEDGPLISFEAGYARVLDVVTPAARSAQTPERRAPGQGINQPLRRHQRRRIGRGRLIEEVSAKVAMGGWAYTRRFDQWVPDVPPTRSWGLYILGEKLLHQSQDGTGQLSGFTRLGTAADAVNLPDFFLGRGDRLPRCFTESAKQCRCSGDCSHPKRIAIPACSAGKGNSDGP
jgi:porin